jgi:ABC-type glutathione transport system ATPase component
VRDTDRIIVLDAGRVVEIGDHESLLARGALYARRPRASSPVSPCRASASYERTSCGVPVLMRNYGGRISRAFADDP